MAQRCEKSKNLRYKMAIKVRLNVVMAERNMSLNTLSQKVGITLANLSILKNGKGKAIRFSTLSALCEALECQPGDLFEFQSDEK